MTTPEVKPRQVVDAPVVLPYRYGLLSTATVTTGDGRWQLGVEYQPTGCIEGGVWEHGWCLPTPDKPGPVQSSHSSGDDALAPEFTATYPDDYESRTITVTVQTAPGGDSNTLDWGDGSDPVNITAGGNYTHTYSSAGTYTITGTGTSTDTEGNTTSGSSTAEITVPWWTHPVKTIDGGMGLVTADPFTVYAGVTCPPVGLPDLAEIARTRLVRTEQQQAEQHLWNQQLNTGDPENLTPGGPVPAHRAVGLLEDHTATALGGIGVIHAPRTLSGLFDTAGLVNRDGPVQRTQLDTPVAFGAGYPEPDSGGVRVYATGPVVVRRTEIFVPATERTGGLNTATNSTFIVAERTYVVTLDCVHAYALIDTSSTAAGRGA